MNRKTNSMLFGAFFLLLVAPACLGDLMCYVCDDCKTVTKDTPLLACNADFFNQGGSSEASTVTTTDDSTISTTDEPAITTDKTVTSDATEPPTSTTELPESSTNPIETTSEPITTESTEAPMPTPATAGPPETTSAVPTPPAEDALPQQETITKLLPTEEVALPVVRQRRAVIQSGPTYHCYSVNRNANNTIYVDRGCLRVDTMQSACGLLREQNPGAVLEKCNPCSMNACNSAAGSAPLLATIFLAALAALLQLK